MSIRCSLRTSIVLALLCVSPARVHADRLRLVPATGEDRVIRPSTMQPVVFDLVVERTAEHKQVSAIAFTLTVPDGVVVVGEELLVESLLGLGSSLTGMNLVFRCVEEQPLRVLRFRVVATKPLQDAVIALQADTRTHFLGLVSCHDEDFAKFESPPDSLTISTR